MPTTSSGVFYEVWGDGPPVVMLPGFGASTDCWTGIAGRLPGFRNLIFDLPGQGRSVAVPSDGRLASLSKTLREAVREVVEPPWVVMGLSMGGAIGLRMALDHPADVDTLVGVVPWNSAGTSPDNEALIAQDGLFGNAEALAGVVSAISRDPSRTGRLAADMLGVSADMWHGWLTGGALVSQADELAGLRVPTFYLIGGEDVVVDQDEQIADIRRIPGGRLVIRGELGHLCCYEAPDVVADEIAHYLRRVRA